MDAMSMADKLIICQTTLGAERNKRNANYKDELKDNRNITSIADDLD